MNLVKTLLIALAGLVGATTLCLALPRGGQQAQVAAGESAMTRHIGAITKINNNIITLKTDSDGGEILVTAGDATRILRVAPGEKNLKNATAATFQDLQTGDRILVGGELSGDAKSIIASTIVLMKHSDVEARQEQNLKDWQRGMGGLVTAVDPAFRTVTISVTGFSGTKNVVIHAGEATVVRRYASGSMKFEDAKPSTLAEIHAGDQLRARGSRTPNGAELTADEIVTGRFRNVAGVIKAMDAATGTISVDDVLSKKSVQLKITSESQLRKMPPELAQHLASRLKGSADGASGTTAGPRANSPTSENGGGQGARPALAAGMEPAGGVGPARSGGAPDFQQMLSRMPALTLSDLHKGDAVMIVATQGEPSEEGRSNEAARRERAPNESTAITLLTGVEPILQAAPSGSQAMMLSPWSLGGPSGDAQNQ